jgi:hypothetical protein
LAFDKFRYVKIRRIFGVDTRPATREDCHERGGFCRAKMQNNGVLQPATREDCHERGCSAMQLKRELQIAYDTAWTISHKIRKAMGDRDENYQLSGVVEMDEAFFGAVTEGGKRGRGTEKTPVAIGL